MNKTIYEDTQEDVYWQTADANEIWVYDKLILSRKLGYACGPVGIDVPVPAWYIVRPCVNIMGLGLGAKKMHLTKYTIDLDPGHFWCEWFDGRHLSVDYEYGKQVLCVEGFKSEDTFTKWDKWIATDDQIPFPKVLEQFVNKPNVNCEFIGGKLIEVHFRSNPDFEQDIKEFIPVWQGQTTEPPNGYRYIDYPDVHGRIGAFIK
tara:strand:- start:415 stop:1026 length:612 start_codon:yes stop_codon:yes gene_type:complete